ncbi:hypothetical protein TNCT_479531 [Trichonephila clavata]|uniref:Uncharacterized protein n=1 Tax=Trichonephila clavata TaxID=2740835 RepID=A0A8X6J5Q4_TRICU|nr:hypothetical protein TNCT_479531 [Trichonephila clavata]
MQEIASRIKLEEEEKFCIIKGLKENKAREMQLQSLGDIQDLKKMKILDIQEKQNPASNFTDFIHPKFSMKKGSNNPTLLAHRQQYRRWNWRGGQHQYSVGYSRNTYSLLKGQYSFLIINPSLVLNVRQCIRGTNDSRNDD